MGSPGDQRLGAGLRSLLRLLPAVTVAGTVGFVALIVVQAALPVVFLVASGRLVGTVPAVVDAGMSSPAGARLLQTLALVAVVYLAMDLVEQVSSVHAENLGRRVDALLRERTVAGCMRPPGIVHLEDPATCAAVDLARNPSTGAFSPAGAVAGLASVVPNRLAVLGSAAVVATFSVWLAAFLLVGVAINVAVPVRYFFAHEKANLGGRGDLRRALYFRDLATTPGPGKEIRVFGLVHWIAGRYDTAWADALDPIRRQRGRRSALGLAAAVVGVGVMMGAGIAVVGLAGAEGRLSLERMAILLAAVRQTIGLSLGLEDVMVAYGAVAVPHLASFHERSTAPGTVVGDHESVPTQSARPHPARPAHSIRLDGVRFAYPGSDREVFTGLDLEIPAGQRLAVVGNNGAGKTTLIKLLTGLYSPTAGRITVDGSLLDDLDPASWRRCLSVLFQDYVRYELTAGENVAFGAPWAVAAQNATALDQAARRAGADTVIAGLAHGWDTVLSGSVEGGTGLSGGQWQRIALARALLALDAGARLIILDEPTANLDVRAEAAVYQRLFELTGSAPPDPAVKRAADPGPPVTTIVVSHRFATVRRADRIVVLEHGRIIEDGSHDELVDQGGRYATMWSLQAARFGGDDDA